MTLFADPSLPLVAAEAALELRRLRLGSCGVDDLRAVASLERGLEHGMPEWVFQEAEALGFGCPSGESEGGQIIPSLSHILDPKRIARIADILRRIKESRNSDELNEAEGFCWELSDCSRQFASIQSSERIGMDVAGYGGAWAH